MTDFEALAQVRERWPQFLAGLHDDQSGGIAGARRVVYSSRQQTPPCDPISLRDGVLVVAARAEHDESLIARDLSQVTQDQWRVAFAPHVVAKARVVSASEATQVLGEELVTLGLQVQRLLKLVRPQAPGGS